jgi:hypothetical protein
MNLGLWIISASKLGCPAEQLQYGNSSGAAWRGKGLIPPKKGSGPQLSEFSTADRARIATGKLKNIISNKQVFTAPRQPGSGGNKELGPDPHHRRRDEFQ